MINETTLPMYLFDDAIECGTLVKVRIIDNPRIYYGVVVRMAMPKLCAECVYSEITIMYLSSEKTDYRSYLDIDSREVQNGKVSLSLLQTEVETDVVG